MIYVGLKKDCRIGVGAEYSIITGDCSVLGWAAEPGLDPGRRRGVRWTRDEGYGVQDQGLQVLLLEPSLGVGSSNQVLPQFSL